MSVRRYSLVRSDGAIWIDDTIGPGSVSASALRRSLREIDPAGSVRVCLDTPGGSHDEGLAIYTALRESGRRIEVLIRSAFSMGAIIAMAGHVVRILPHGQIGLHASRYCEGYVADRAPPPGSALTAPVLRRLARGLSGSASTRQEAESIERLAFSAEAADATHLDILARRSGLPRARLAELRAAEAVLNAEQAVALGLADEILSQERAYV